MHILVKCLLYVYCLQSFPLFGAQGTACAIDPAAQQAADEDEVETVASCQEKQTQGLDFYTLFQEHINPSMSDDQLVEQFDRLKPEELSEEQRDQLSQARQALTAQPRRKLYDAIGHTAYTHIQQTGDEPLQEFVDFAQESEPTALMQKLVNFYQGRSDQTDQTASTQLATHLLTPAQQQLLSILGSDEYHLVMNNPEYVEHKNKLLAEINTALNAEQEVNAMKLFRQHIEYVRCFNIIQAAKAKKAAKEAQKKGRLPKPIATSATPSPTPAAPAPSASEPRKSPADGKITDANKNLTAALSRIKGAKRYLKHMKPAEKKELKEQAKNHLEENKSIKALAGRINALPSDDNTFDQQKLSALRRFAKLTGDIYKEIEGIK